MNHKRNAAGVIILLALGALSFQTMAGAPIFTDVRALAMGGVGVTAARPAAAGFFNPALLSVKQPDKRDSLGILMPSANVVAYDKEELRKAVDDFEDNYLKPFESSITDLENNIGGSGQAAAQEALADRTEAINNELARINQDQIRVDLGVGSSVLVPSETFGAGVFISSAARISALVNYQDQQKLDSLENLVRTQTVNDIQEVYDFYDLTDSTDQLDTTVRAVGTASSQVGVAMSYRFNFGGHDYALGASPKMVNLRAYDFVASVDDVDFDDVKDTKASESKFNFDLGMATFLDDDEQILAGVSLINVLPMSIKTKPNFDRTNLNSVTVNAIEIEQKPVLTAGISYIGESYEVATDIELSKTEEVFGEGDTQYWGVGAEYDLAEMLQARVGARYNLASSESLVFTAGFGVRLAGLTFEMAALGSTDENTLGAGLQLGFTM